MSGIMTEVYAIVSQIVLSSLILLGVVLLAFDANAGAFLPCLGMALLDENRISLTEVAKKAGVNVSTVWRWALKGVRGVFLETYSIGSRRYSTSESYRRFAERCTAAACGDRTNSSADSQRKEETSRTESELDEVGIGTTGFQSAKKPDPLESGHNSQAPGIAPFDKQGAKR
jgi:hypothetical protein